MYSKKEKLKAIKLYIKYNKKSSTVRRELGYPTKNALRNWYKDYIANGEKIINNKKRKPKYTKKERDIAVKYYLEHGRNISDTVKYLGYPCRSVLSNWIVEDVPNHKISCLKGATKLSYDHKLKEAAVIDLSLRKSSAQKVSDKYGTTRCSIYSWRNKLLSSEGKSIMNKRKTEEPKESTTNEELVKLQEEVNKLRLEKDILEEAIKLIKKDMGINVCELSNNEKTLIINALSYKYEIKTLIKKLSIPKSSYYYHLKRLIKGDKYSGIRNILKTIFEDNYKSYGYRRIYVELKKQGIVLSEKVVRRLMKEENLIVIYVKKKKYSSYLGEISPEVENIIKRDFKSLKPNKKMITDITEFPLPKGKVYLSPLIDCFDGLVASYTISTTPDSTLVNTMLSSYIDTLKEDEYPIIHTDRGAHYRWPGWIKLMDDTKLIRSMSKKGCSPDNSACEGFFGRLKNEMFYNRDWMGVSIEHFIEELNKYILWYNCHRIKKSLGSMSPMEYRIKLGIN